MNGITNVGDIIYKRSTTPVRKFDYTYWSSPVAPQTLVGLSPLTQYDKYYSFSPAINNWISETSTNLMIAGKGYIIRAPNTHDAVTPSIFNGQFFGTPNNGVISTPIAVSYTHLDVYKRQTHNNIKASPFQNKITFTPPADGVYYFGLKAFSDPNNGQLFVDDLQVYELSLIHI